MWGADAMKVRRDVMVTEGSGRGWEGQERGMTGKGPG